MKKENIKNFLIVIIVFGLTGATSVFVSRFIMGMLGFKPWSIQYVLGYIFIIFPLYQITLLGYASIFGRFEFFFNRQKKIAKKIKNIFVRSS